MRNPQARYRDQVLQMAGYRVVRFTWRQILSNPERVAATIRALLAGTLTHGGARALAPTR